MGSEGGSIHSKRKLRLLCLHGFRTSGEIIRKQVTGKWPESVLEKLDLVCVNAPFPSQGKSDVEGIFDPPYFEWFQFNKEFSEYQNFDESLAYIEECIIKHGPFDGLLGFSQGAILSAAMPGLQANGVCLTKVPKIKLVVIIGGAKFRNPSVAEKAYSSQIQCPSVHFLGGTISSFVTFLEVQPTEHLRLFSIWLDAANRRILARTHLQGDKLLRLKIGETDFLKPHGTELLDSFVEPMVIHHPKGHTIPRFDEKGLESMLKFLETMQIEVEDGGK